MSKMRVLRHEVPIDDEWHGFDISGAPLHVGMRADRTGGNAVEFWAIDAPGHFLRTTRYFRVYGTGMELPHHVRYCGTTFSESGALVWHLFEDTVAQ